MVLGDSTTWWEDPSGRVPLGFRDTPDRVPPGLEETPIGQSQVLQAVMDTLSNMLNNTASGYLGNASLFKGSGMNSSSVDEKLKGFIDSDAGEDYLGIGDSTKALVVIVIGVVFAVVTTLGNLMVMVSFKLDKQLQSISNYFLFSLAVADITIGVISIPLMTYYTATGYWGIGYTMCQFWLCIDYLMSNASVLNLLLISFDRYFSVTRPLTYRPRRTTRKAMTMIACTYIISLILWPPWIISWPYIEGEFTAEPGACVVQFLETNPYVTVGTAVAAFYLPVTIMIILYSRVYCETKRRQREFRKLQAGQMRNRTSASGATSALQNPGSLKKKQLFPFMDGLIKPRIDKKDRRYSWFRTCTGRSEFSSEESSEVLPNNVDDTSVTSSVYATSLTRKSLKNSSNPGAPEESASRENSGDLQSPKEKSKLVNGSGSSGSRFRSRNASEKPVLHTYTVVIELHDGGKRPSVRLSACDTEGPNTGTPSIRQPMRKRSRSDVTVTLDDMKRVSLTATDGGVVGLSTQGSQKSQGSELQNGKTKGIEKGDVRKSEKERRKNERKQDSKAAKTLSAILIAFIVTWTPYNVVVCWEAFFPNSIPDNIFAISYFLCYINSTINPLCYALCNARFRLTYMRILRCRFKMERGPQNGLYQKFQRAKLAGFNLDDPSTVSEESQKQLKYYEKLGEENNDVPVETHEFDEESLSKFKESKSVRFAPQKIETTSPEPLVRVDQSTAAPEITLPKEIVSAEETSAKDSEQKCNNEELRKLIIENISENSADSKHAVNKAAEAKFGATMDVICSRGHFSYIYSSNLFCEAAQGEVTCIAFRQSL
ncbi:hypothetical protein FO519_004471 [Halicephalobus sp. NKZ332]|nr:hypothetical protein FO519_004471 [Halicephalobus sp. NKZ332]